MRHEAILYNF